jgi:hypothetical protein
MEYRPSIEGFADNKEQIMPRFWEADNLPELVTTSGRQL